MKAVTGNMVVKGYFSSDVEDIEKWMPNNPKDVYLWISIDIGGRNGRPGSDIWQVLIATPDGLKRAEGWIKSPVINDRATIIFSDYDWLTVKNTIEKIVKDCASETLVESQCKLQRYFQWEYEDYKIADDDSGD